MSSSYFSYNITRSYPYGWFTPVVVIGGIALMALFSVVNLAATGYEASVSYETNTTVIENPATRAWYQKQPWSWASKVSSKCQDQTISVGSQFYTTNFAFPYTIISINTTTAQNETRSSASFAYHNEPLDNCRFSSIKIGQWDQSSSSLTAEVLLACQIPAATLVTTIELEVNIIIGFFLISTTPVALPTFLDLSNSTQPSLAWGSKIIQETFLWVTQMPLFSAEWGPDLKDFDADQTGLLLSTDTSFTIGFSDFGAQFSPSVRDSSNLTEVYWTLSRHDTSGSFCPKRNAAGQCYIELGEWISNHGVEILKWDLNYYTSNDSSVTHYLGTEINAASLNIIGLDGLAKSLYWTILTDLGQSVETNMFTNPQGVLDFWNTTAGLVQDFALLLVGSHSQSSTEATDSYLGVGDKDMMMANGSAPTDPAKFFAWYGTGIPQPTTASIATQYLCSVPKLKPTGSLLVGILVADFVFFQVVWRVFNLIMVFFLNRQQPQAQYCSGCSKRLSETSEEEIEMGSLHTLPSHVSTERGYERLPNPVGGFAGTALAPATTSGAEYLDSTVDHRVPRKPIATAQSKSVSSDYDEHDTSEQ